MRFPITSSNILNIVNDNLADSILSAFEYGGVEINSVAGIVAVHESDEFHYITTISLGDSKVSPELIKRVLGDQDITITTANGDEVKPLVVAFYLVSGDTSLQKNMSSKNILSSSDVILNTQDPFVTLIMSDSPKIAHMGCFKEPATMVVIADCPNDPKNDFMTFLSKFSPAGSIVEYKVGDSFKSIKILAHDSPTAETSPFYSVSQETAVYLRYECNELNYPRQCNRPFESITLLLGDIASYSGDTIIGDQKNDIEYIHLTGNTQTGVTSAGVFSEEYLPHLEKWLMNHYPKLNNAPNIVIGYIDDSTRESVLKKFLMTIVSNQELSFNDLRVILPMIRWEGSRKPVFNILNSPTFTSFVALPSNKKLPHVASLTRIKLMAEVNKQVR